jgi:hypothetical protein
LVQGVADLDLRLANGVRDSGLNEGALAQIQEVAALLQRGIQLREDLGAHLAHFGMLIDQLVDQEGRAAQRGFVLQDLKLHQFIEVHGVHPKLRYLDDMSAPRWRQAA